MKNAQQDNANPFLEEAYTSQGFKEGSLIDAVKQPLSLIQNEEWLEKGDWLTLAEKVGADKIFFVKDDPVFIFYNFTQKPTEQEELDTFRRVWCMARPQCLFMAFPGELKVYNLNQTPAANVQEWQKIKPLSVVKKINEVASKLYDFRREQVESGELFADSRFRNIDQRADKRLIQDLKEVRELLTTVNSFNEKALDLKFAHALIGRSIFIRYLEDRGVLTPKYFEEVAEQNQVWQELLKNEPDGVDMSMGAEDRRFDRVLADKDFTYAVFERLSQDFNGDMFPHDLQEEGEVTSAHLNLLCGFLRGKITNLSQGRMFFWAYDFKIVPIDLISSIYEEFYHSSNRITRNNNSTHYTSRTLVDLVLSKVLTKNKLYSNPRVLDPACGSGIFLVEAFRRIVRFRVQENKGLLLSSDELRQILKDQILGIEINDEAIRVAAFSLYLALLNYQEPPDIQANKRLPFLIYKENEKTDDNYYQILVNKNAFSLTTEELKVLQGRLKATKDAKEKSGLFQLLSLNEYLPINSNSIDIIVGNPPWGEEKADTTEISTGAELINLWSRLFNWSIGDNELSQAFIARTISLIKPSGEVGLLVSSGVFLKHQDVSEDFRTKWLKKATVNLVISFVHVRHAFFKADAPFVFVSFKLEKPKYEHMLQYWSAKKSQTVSNTLNVLLNYNDLHVVNQNELLNNQFLWKTYWWGNHIDANLIKLFRTEDTLLDFSKSKGLPPGQGFTPGHKSSSGWLKEYKFLPVRNLFRYGKLSSTHFEEAPDKVNSKGKRYLYDGKRILVKRNIGKEFLTGKKGFVDARLEFESFCFNNSVNAIRLDNAEDWELKIILGILWSSLARYYYFLTVSSWGVWHYDLHLEEVVSLPIRMPNNEELRNTIIDIVNKLQDLDFTLVEGIAELENKLDNAVFDLYGLIEPERDLILDMCEFGIDFLYNHSNSEAAQKVAKYPSQNQGYVSDLPGKRNYERGLEGYLFSFLEIWNREIEPNGEFSWCVIRPKIVPMLAIIFSTREIGSPLPVEEVNEDAEWEEILKKSSIYLNQEVSRSIFIDGIVRVVSETDIIIIKRDEQRLWTRSMGREDAEATLLQAMNLQQE